MSAFPNRSFNGRCLAVDGVELNFLAHQFAEAIGKFLRVFIDVLVFFFHFKGDFQTIVVI